MNQEEIIRSPATGELRHRQVSSTPVETLPAPSLGRFPSFVISLPLSRRRPPYAKVSRRYRAIGESINYGVWVCAPDGRNIYASDSFLKLVGLTQSQCSEFGRGDGLHPG